MSPAQAAVSQPVPDPPVAQPSSGIQISQVSTQGPGGTRDEFVELHNVGAFPLDVSGYTVWACPAAGPQVLLATIPSGTVLDGTTTMVGTGPFYLLANAAGYSRLAAPDLFYNGDIQRLGGVLLRGAPTMSQPLGAQIDAVGFSVGNSCTEQAPAPAQSPNFI